MPKLGVNIDHVATLRQARGTAYPDILSAARLCEQAGAEGITVHLREDRRHIQDNDVKVLKENIKTRLNLEMAMTDEMISIAEAIKPNSVCIVPEKRQELTTEGGLDVIAHSDGLQALRKRLNDAGIQVSLFIDPNSKQIEASKEVGAQMVEIHTGTYCDATGAKREQELNHVLTSIAYANELKLICNAGHGLDTKNILPLATHSDIYEFNIGHSIICRAVFVGLRAAVSEMATILKG